MRGGLIKKDSYRIHTGTRECPVIFNVQAFRPDAEGPWPVVVDGDGCFDYHCDKVEDVRRLVNVMCHIRDGEEPEDTFFETPFQQPELIFDWRNPNA